MTHSTAYNLLMRKIRRLKYCIKRDGHRIHEEHRKMLSRIRDLFYQKKMELSWTEKGTILVNLSEHNLGMKTDKQKHQIHLF